MAVLSFSRQALTTNKWLLFIVLCTITLLLLLLKKSFLESGTAAFEVLELRGEAGLLQMLAALQYATIPIVYLWKFVIISFLLWVGCFLFGYNISFARCFQVALLAEFIFIIPEALKILHFLFVAGDSSLYDINVYYPLSLINLTDTDTLARKWVYPLKAVNIFEFIYWFLLYYLLHLTSGKDKRIALAIVVLFYILPFIGWLFYYAGIYK
jgi:hypothetical protein